MDDSKVVAELTEEVVNQVLNRCPCRAIKGEDDKITTEYTCQSAEDRDILARVLEEPSIIKVKRQVIEAKS